MIIDVAGTPPSGRGIPPLAWLLVLLVACRPAAPASFAGSASCAACHQAEAAAWQPSQHARAIQPATDSTMLAPFAGETFTHGGVTSTFLRRDGGFVVRTDGPDGALTDFRVTHTFGLEPLQQYLLELPNGRVQALSIAWDSRTREQGGQRWFHLYPAEQLRAGDPLHWTGYLQNWNQMCADCHSTDVRKGYDQASHGYVTTRSEDGVGCEACHGPASAHVAWAGRPAALRWLWRDDGLVQRLDERRDAAWRAGTRADPPVRSAPRRTDREIETCARCHARRAQLTDAVSAANSIHEGFRVSLLEPGLYWSDGQQRDEVYNYGSFVQSRMYQQGVTCGDCHDPHTSKLRAPGNAACAQCHAPATYDAASHHFHEPGTPGASCAACHMPTTTYMVNDPRHDHSFRVPRPDRTVSLGVPNACDQCHADKGAAWAAAEIAKRAPDGATGAQAFAEAFVALEQGAQGAAGSVLAIAADSSQPAIVRASALDRLVRAGASVDPALLQVLASHPNPLLRIGVALAGSALPDAGARVAVLAPLLTDSMRSVRIEAASGLAPVPAAEIPESARAPLEAARAEYVAVQRFGADRPEAQVNLGSALAAQGDIPGARAAFAEAVRLDSSFIPAYVNLADAERALGEEAKGEAALRRAMVLGPASGMPAHALGLSLIRQRRYAEGLEMLGEAVRREPASSRYAYVYAVALHDGGRPEQAVRVLEDALARHPDDPQLRAAYAAYQPPPR
jgi:tetratricopeptide (TPR) repeat protein